MQYLSFNTLAENCINYFFYLVGMIYNVHVKLPLKEGDGEEGFLSVSIYEDLRSRMCRKRRPFLQLLFLALIYSILLPFLLLVNTCKSQSQAIVKCADPG